MSREDEGRGRAMNCDAIVKKHLAPWAPNREARNLDALHVHDFPLIGTFELGDDTILFACLTGAMSRSNVWAYTCLSETQRQALDAFDAETTEELEQFVHSLFEGNRAAFALALDGEVREWSAGDVATDQHVMDVAITFMDNTIKASRSSKRKAAQARADVTREALVPA